jgi:hypothetical protein
MWFLGLNYSYIVIIIFSSLSKCQGKTSQINHGDIVYQAYLARLQFFLGHRSFE